MITKTLNNVIKVNGKYHCINPLTLDEKSLYYITYVKYE